MITRNNQGSTAALKVLNVMLTARRPLTLKEIAAFSESSYPTVRRQIAELEASGFPMIEGTVINENGNRALTYKWSGQIVRWI